MERKPLAQLLEDMLYEGGDAGLEVCLAEATLDSREGVGAERALRIEYAQRYERAVAAIEEHRGPPSVAGRRGTPGMPEWLQLDAASCWSDAAGVIYVGLSIALPYARLVGGGRPHPVRPQAITILPSAE